MNRYFICGRVSLSCRLLIFIKRIVGIAVGIEGVESCTIVRVEGQPKFDAPREVWVGNEMTSERNLTYNAKAPRNVVARISCPFECEFQDLHG